MSAKTVPILLGHIKSRTTLDLREIKKALDPSPYNQKRWWLDAVARAHSGQCDIAFRNIRKWMRQHYGA